MSFGKLKTPPILEAYNSPSRVIANDEWKAVAKEMRKREGMFEMMLSKMKESVRDRIAKKLGMTTGYSGKPELPTWYSWQVENWGTKWDMLNPNVPRDGEELDIQLKCGDDESQLFINQLFAW